MEPRSPIDRTTSSTAPLTTDLTDPQAVPYFTWDDPMTVAEIKQRLASASPPERYRLLARILREARDTDVWAFTSPDEVVASWPEIEPRLGRRRGFWRFLLARWERQGRLSGAWPR